MRISITAVRFSKSSRETPRSTGRKSMSVRSEKLNWEVILPTALRTRRAMLKQLLILAIAGLASGICPAAEQPRPNILLLWLDNVGYGDLGCYGNRHAKTPHIDRLALEGVRCTDFYIASPSCSPSR